MYKINTRSPAAITYKDTVATTGDLPLTGNVLGDMYIVEQDGHMYIWKSNNSSGTIEDWVDSGPGVDMSKYRTAADQDVIDSGKQAKITASGILKGDGNGGVASAIAGTDYDTASNIVSATAAMTPEQAAQTRQNIGADTPETVAAWLDEHVDPETGYVLDNSLTVEGAAADAKATGDAVDELRAHVTNLEVTKLGYIFDESGAGWTEGYEKSQIGSNGSIYKQDGTLWGANYYHTEPIEVSQGDLVVVKSAGSTTYFNIYYYSSWTDEHNFTLVEKLTCTAEENEIHLVIPDDGFVRLQVKSNIVARSYAHVWKNIVRETYLNTKSLTTMKTPITVGGFNVRDFSDDGQGTGCTNANVATYLPQWKELVSTKLNLDFLCINEWYPWFDRNETINAYDTIFKQFYPYKYALPESNPTKIILSKYEFTPLNYNQSAFPMPTAILDISGKRVAVVCWLQSGSVTPEVRQGNYAAAVEYFAGYDVTVFAGDFNTNAGTAELVTFTDAGYTLGNGGYWGEIGTHDTSNPDYPNGLPLDNVVAKGIIYELFEKVDEKLTSDHNGVRATLIV